MVFQTIVTPEYNTRKNLRAPMIRSTGPLSLAHVLIGRRYRFNDTATPVL